jgi:MFS family permease
MNWRIVPMLMVVVSLAHFNRISISVAGAEKILPAGLISETRMGLIYSAFLLLYTVCMIPGGWFIDRYGPRAAWMVLCFGSAAGAALTGLAGWLFTEGLGLFMALLLVRSLMGLTNAPLHPGGARLVANWVPPSGVAQANGLVAGSACGGIAVTYFVFGNLIDQFGWPQAFLVASGATLVVALIWCLTAADDPGEKTTNNKTGPENFTPLLRNRGLLCLTLSYGMVGYFQYLFFYWAEYYFETVLKLPKEVGRWYSTYLTLAMGGGMVLGGRLTDLAKARLGLRLGLAVVPVGGLLLAAAGSAVGALAEGRGWTLAGFAVAMAAVGSTEGSFWTTAVHIGGRRGGTAAAILNTGGNGFGLVAPVLTPLIARQYGWNAGLLLASGVCVAGALLWSGVTVGESQKYQIDSL